MLYYVIIAFFCVIKLFYSDITLSYCVITMTYFYYTAIMSCYNNNSAILYQHSALFSSQCAVVSLLYTIITSQCHIMAWQCPIILSQYFYFDIKMLWCDTSVTCVVMLVLYLCQYTYVSSQCPTVTLICCNTSYVLLWVNSAYGTRHYLTITSLKWYCD